MNRIFVFAGNKEEFYQYLIEKEISCSDAVYIDKSDSLASLCPKEIIFTGSWIQRSDKQSVKDCASVYGITIGYDYY